MARQIHNLLVNNIVEKAIREAGARYLRGKLIDIGCGTKPYRNLLREYVTDHLGVDHEGCLHDTSNRDYIGTAYKIPVENNSFDSALCSSVLEHLEEPEQAIRECHRVLRPGGCAIYTVPFIWHLHEEPRDFFRYSTYGLRYLFDKTGFEIVEIIPLSGFWVTFGQLFVYYIFRFHRGFLRWIPIIPAAGLAIQGMSYLLDRLDRADQWTWMYLVVARKPEASQT